MCRNKRTTRCEWDDRVPQRLLVLQTPCSMLWASLWIYSFQGPEDPTTKTVKYEHWCNESTVVYRIFVVLRSVSLNPKNNQVCQNDAYIPWKRKAPSNIFIVKASDTVCNPMTLLKLQNHSQKHPSIWYMFKLLWPCHGNSRCFCECTKIELLWHLKM